MNGKFGIWEIDLLAQHDFRRGDKVVGMIESTTCLYAGKINGLASSYRANRSRFLEYRMEIKSRRRKRGGSWVAICGVTTSVWSFKGYRTQKSEPSATID